MGVRRRTETPPREGSPSGSNRCAATRSEGTGPGGADSARTGGSGRGGAGRARISRGLVSLVGAGPGDPELLTVRAVRRLQEADVVYHDALVSEAVLALCRDDARWVRVGKRRGAASTSQERIEAALVRDAQAGLRVVRLKGGDPYVFGRGGEEALALARHGIRFEVVPGLSSGTAVPAAAGIPLTHRGISSSAAFLTAHELGDPAGGSERRERLAHLAKGADTLVLFMAGSELGRARETLLAAGLTASTPAALIENGTGADERVYLGTLGTLESIRGREHPSGGPVLIVIGRTVSLATSLRAGSVPRASGRAAGPGLLGWVARAVAGAERERPPAPGSPPVKAGPASPEHPDELQPATRSSRAEPEAAPRATGAAPRRLSASRRHE